MPRSTSSQGRHSKAAHITAIFWASSDNLRLREIKDLERYGVPPALRGFEPIRAGYVMFEELGFEFKKGGVRAFLFLITNERGEVLDIVAWAPLLNHCATWGGNYRGAREDTTVNSASGAHQHGNQEEVI
jgi:hypothetical protein